MVGLMGIIELTKYWMLIYNTKNVYLNYYFSSWSGWLWNRTTIFQMHCSTENLYRYTFLIQIEKQFTLLWNNICNSPNIIDDYLRYFSFENRWISRIGWICSIFLDLFNLGREIHIYGGISIELFSVNYGS